MKYHFCCFIIQNQVLIFLRPYIWVYALEVLFHALKFCFRTWKTYLFSLHRDVVFDPRDKYKAGFILVPKYVGNINKKVPIMCEIFVCQLLHLLLYRIFNFMKRNAHKMSIHSIFAWEPQILIRHCLASYFSLFYISLFEMYGK